jgi:putative aminopeptidase FrvX
MRELIRELMLIPGLAGHEDRVRSAIAAHLDRIGLAPRTDRLGNLIATVRGDEAAPAVMLFAHMDQLGFVVRRIEDDGLLRLERLGGVPERALAAQAVVVCADGGDLPGVIGTKSHHATGPDEKYRVVPYAEIRVDAGFATRAEAAAAGVRIGTPVVYLPRVLDLAGGRIAGTSVDDRAGCAALVALAGRISGEWAGPTVHFVWSVQEEFNLRGVLPAAAALNPAIAFQIDLMLATDTPDMAARGDMRLGGGAAISLYSFHGRGTLNGVIPHPALVRLAEAAARDLDIPLQRSAQTGVLTDLSYIQFQGTEGVACLDLGFPVRYTHSALEVCDPSDVAALVDLLAAMLGRIGPEFDLSRGAL